MYICREINHFYGLEPFEKKNCEDNMKINRLEAH